MGVSDLGLSSGLVNSVGRAYGRNDWTQIRTLVSTAFVAFALVSSIALVIAGALSAWPSVPALLGLAKGSLLARQASLLLGICGSLFAFSFLLQASGPLALSLQEGYLASIANMAANGLLITTLGIIAWRGATLTQFAFAMGAPALIANGGLAFYFFFVRHPDIRPSFRRCRLESLGIVMGFGGPLFLVQLSDIGILYSANVVVSNKLGPGSVPLYSIPLSLFMVCQGICYLLVSPYIACYAEASARNDWTWIRHAAFRRLALVMPLVAAFGAAAVAIGPYVVRTWTHAAVIPSRQFLLAMSIYVLLMVWATTNGALINGLGKVRLLAGLHLTTAVLFITGSYLILPRFGIIGIPIAGTAAYLIEGCISLPMALRHLSIGQRQFASPEPITTLPLREMSES
jgi:O-antigen/teichoic acid export membrane protein